MHLVAKGVLVSHDWAEKRQAKVGKKSVLGKASQHVRAVISRVKV